MRFSTSPYLYTPISFLSALHLHLNCIPPLPYLLAFHFAFLNYLWLLSCSQNLSPPFFHTTTSFPDPPTPAWPIPSHLPAPTCPHSIFSLFQPFMDAFRGRFVFYSMYTCTYTIVIIEYRRFDRFFFGCSKLPGKGECTAIYGGSQGSKKRPNIHIAPSIHTQCIQYSKCAVMGPCGAPMQPQLAAVENAQPPDWIRHRKKSDQ